MCNRIMTELGLTDGGGLAGGHAVARKLGTKRGEVFTGRNTNVKLLLSQSFLKQTKTIKAENMENQKGKKEPGSAQKKKQTQQK